MRHQFVDRPSGELRDETFFGDRVVRLLYGAAREDGSLLMRALTSQRLSKWLGYLNYDFPLAAKLTGSRRFTERLGILADECVDDPSTFRSARDVFERRIRYWDCRPMDADPSVVVSPADARMLHGSLHDSPTLRIKERFFDFEELLGADRTRWLHRLHGGDFAVFRLTPDKYHWVHTPVAGRVVDVYAVDGGCHSCNPVAAVAEVGALSKNRREVTIIDTDVEGGTGVGLVAVIEVVALMIGAIEQRYSATGYDAPRPIETGLHVERGRPKSIFKPGSSTVVLLFERGRIRFDDDLDANVAHPRARSRFTVGIDGARLVETDMNVRASIGRARRGHHDD
ncbi:MAG: phosphatidylserine decarboxylase [Planctomycetota bacterium]